MPDENILRRAESELTAFSRQTQVGQGPQPASQAAHQQSELQAGDVVAARYRIVSHIGSGAMGSVYLVEQIFLHTQFALKTLNPILASQRNLRRFQNEAQAASKLNHPNLVRAVDFGMIDETRPFLVMDYVKGDSLLHHLQQKSVLPIDEALALFIPLCSAMAYAHGEGVIHRDIKPGNIVLVTEPGSAAVIPKIVDFGIAKLAEEGQNLTKTGEVFGTPLYMSPEQCSGDAVDERSDIYSLGCVLYEVLTGDAPLKANTALETMMKHLNEMPVSLKSATLGNPFPDALEKSVAKMLMKSPHQRYSNFSEVTNDLYWIQQGKYDKVLTGSKPQFDTLGASKRMLWIGGVIIAALSIVVCIPLFKQETFAPAEKPTYVKLLEPPDVKPIAPNLRKFSSELITEDGKKMRVFHFGPHEIGRIWSSKYLYKLDHPGFENDRAAKGTVKFPADQFIAFKVGHELMLGGLDCLRQFNNSGLAGLRAEPDTLSYAESPAEQKMLDDVLYYACDIGGLQYLNICGAVSKSGIESIDRMKSLKSLTFDKCEVSPADIASMHSLGRLDAIRMQNTPRSREIIPALLKQPLQANWIEFIHCGLGNADLASIAKLKTVRYLNIEANVKITDQGLSHLASMPQLAGLTARGCTITAKSLPIFARMRNLNNLSISLDKWSHADRERLIEVLPKSCIFK